MTELAMSPPEQERKSERAGLMFLRQPGSASWDKTVDLEAEVFMERHYVANKAELEAEYAPYLPKTRLLSMVKGQEVIGCLRLIDYDPEIGLKTLHDIESGRLQLSEEGRRLLEGIDLNDTFEGGTIALAKDYRVSADQSSIFSDFLYAGVAAHSRKYGKPYALASFDAGFFEGFQRKYGGVHALGPAVEYMGSPTIPALVDIEGVIQHLKDTDRSDLAYILEFGGDQIKDES